MDPGCQAAMERPQPGRRDPGGGGDCSHSSCAEADPQPGISRAGFVGAAPGGAAELGHCVQLQGLGLARRSLPGRVGHGYSPFPAGTCGLAAQTPVHRSRRPRVHCNRCWSRACRRRLCVLPDKLVEWGGRDCPGAARWAWGVACALVLVPGLFQMWPSDSGAKNALSQTEVVGLIERDMAQWLTRHAGKEGAVVLATPYETTTQIGRAHV